MDIVALKSKFVRIDQMNDAEHGVASGQNHYAATNVSEIDG